MKINETLENILSHGIFYSLFETGQIDWLTESDAEIYDLEYYNSHSGEKTISIFYAKLLEQQQQGVIDDALNYLSKVIAVKFKDNWSKLREAMLGNYNPIENYSMVEVETPNIQTSSKTNVKQKIKNESDNSRYGFNSVSNQPVDKTVSVISGDSDENESNTVVSNTGNRTLTRSGNIGVTTSQQMIESEINLRKQKFIDLVYSDIDTVMTLPIYE